MTKKDWLFKLRRITERESLEKIIEKKYYELSDAELAVRSIIMSINAGRVACRASHDRDINAAKNIPAAWHRRLAVGIPTLKWWGGCQLRNNIVDYPTGYRVRKSSSALRKSNTLVKTCKLLNIKRNNFI